MNKKKVEIGEFWEKRDFRQSWFMFFLIIIAACVFIYSSIYLIDKYIKANDLTFIKFNINPEFGFVVNGNDEVVYYLSLNEEASDIMTIDMFKELKLNEAVDKLIDIVKNNGYLDDEKNIGITVMDKDKFDKKELEDKVIKLISKKDKTIVLDILTADDKELDLFKNISLDKIDIIKERVKNEYINNKECNYTNVIYEDLSVEDKFKTAINISNKLYSNGSDNLILVNVNDLVSGYISVSLSSVLNAPILFVETNSIKDVIVDEIKRINPVNIYVVGGKDYISDKVISSVKTSVGLEPTRLTGKDRYEISVNVAKMIGEKENINSVILVSGEKDLTDAGLISSVSGKLKTPIIYSKNNTLNSSAKDFIKNNKNISSIYVVGELLTDNVINDLKSLGRSVEIIGNNDKYNTNIEIINKFYKYFDSLIIVNNLNDIVNAANYSYKTDSVLFYVSDVLNEEHVRIIKNNPNIKNISYFGLSNIKGVFRDILFNVKKNNMSKCNELNNELLFTTSKAVFYIPHQGDESIYFGQVITAAIDKLGEENVHLVLFNKGNDNSVYKDGIINDEILGNYQYLDITSARDKEYKNSINELGVKTNTFVEELVSVEGLSHITSRFDDASLSKNKNQVKDIMKYYDTLYNNDVTHITYTSFDENVDHNTLGSVLSELYFDNTLDEKQFENVYLIVKNTDNQTIIDEKYSIILDNKNNYSKILKSINMYKEDIENKILGIGYKSNSKTFDSVIDKINDKELKTVIHIPYKK